MQIDATAIANPAADSDTTMGNYLALGTIALQVAENVGANPKSLQMDSWHIGSSHEQFDDNNSLMDFMSEQDHRSSVPLVSNMETMEISLPWVNRSEEGARSTEDVY